MAASRSFQNSVISSLASGLVLGFMEIIIAISLGTLIFSEAAPDQLARGIGIGLITVAIHLVCMGIFSAIPIIISSIQDSPTVLFSVAAAAISKTLLPDADLVATIVVMTGIVTLLTGLFMFLLGFFRLGGLGRYLPYPLTGGFLAGTGWLLVQGSFGTMAGISPSLDAPPILMNRVSLWLPGLLFAIALFVGVRVSKHPLTLPIIIFGTIVLFLDGWH